MWEWLKNKLTRRKRFEAKLKELTEFYGGIDRTLTFEELVRFEELLKLARTSTEFIQCLELHESLDDRIA